MLNREGSIGLFFIGISTFLTTSAASAYVAGLFRQTDINWKDNQPWVYKWEGQKSVSIDDKGNRTVFMNRRNPLFSNQTVTVFEATGFGANTITVEAVDPDSYDQAIDYLNAQKCAILVDKIAEVGPQDKFIKKVVPVEDSNCLG